MKTASTRTTHCTSSTSDIQKFLGLVLAIASTGAMVMTLQSLMQGWVAKSLSIGAGIALQGCLYLFANHVNHRIRWFSYLLLAFSVIATTWFMDVTWQQQQNKQAQENLQQNEQSWQAEQIRSQINELNQQIAIGLDSASTDTSSNYRQRGIDTLTSLDDMRQRRDKLMAELNTLAATGTTQSEQSTFEATPQLRILLFAMIAIIIDVSAILAFGTLELTRFKPTWHEPEFKPEPKHSDPVMQSPEPQTQVYWHQTPAPLPQNPAQNPVAQQPEEQPEPEPKPDYLGSILAKIRNGEYGEFVPVKQIVESEPIRHHELKAGIDQLIEEGVLTKSGNRYRHVGFQNQTELCMS